ncbi:sensor histidine kinase [Chryseosolibacter histidini]|uniref:sensor histidine kinase n=1 Tax=Chryseosolibacter histidini TaxID=2782349 RepID=UPI0020B3FE59|nr:histidine kinase [Chryseosolibacter histidini]
MLQNLSYRKLGIVYLLWCISWIVLQTLALQNTFGFGWETSLKDAVITNVLIAIKGYIMISMMRFYQPHQVTRLGISIALAFLAVFVMEKIAPIVIGQQEDYLAFLERSSFIRGLYCWLMITLVSALSWLWFSIREQQEIEARKTATEKLAREAELSRLRQQLQPHFLFNSLNSISALAGTRPEEARKMIQQLSDFLRGTLKKDDQQLVTLGEELDHLQLYLDIEKVRFGHRLRTHIDRDDVSLGMKLPSLLLQPVVENAIKFGLYDTTGETIIRLMVRTEDNYLVVVVENPFDPGTAQPKQGTGFGLTSVKRRLYLLYARQDLLTTYQEENVFTTQIKIPQSI